jgi:glycosyltransferase involved in cell wall biosynthesis
MHEEIDKVPKVSIITIALKPEEFNPVLAHLSKQTYQDFEFIGEAGGSIPSAWNRAIKRARGEILVFTETDAQPINEYWLDEMVNEVSDSQTIVKGLEVTTSPFDFSNLAVHRNIFNDNLFNKSYHLLSDIELLSKLKGKNYHLVAIDKAPIINYAKAYNRHFLRKSFRYGFEWGRLKKHYKEPVQVPDLSFLTNRLIASFYLLVGMFFGYFIYLPERKKRERFNG